MKENSGRWFIVKKKKEKGRRKKGRKK